MTEFPRYIFLLQANGGHDWVDYSSALLTPLIAIIAICVAIKQVKVSRNQLKSELFERRVKVYDAMRNAIFRVLIVDKLDVSDVRDFLNGTLGVNWLFDNDIVNYKNELHDNIVKIGIEIDEKKRFELRRWFHKESAILDERFKKYLLLKH